MPFTSLSELLESLANWRAPFLSFHGSCRKVGHGIWQLNILSEKKGLPSASCRCQRVLALPEIPDPENRTNSGSLEMEYVTDIHTGPAKRAYVPQQRDGWPPKTNSAANTLFTYLNEGITESPRDLHCGRLVLAPGVLGPSKKVQMYRRPPTARTLWLGPPVIFLHRTAFLPRRWKPQVTQSSHLRLKCQKAMIASSRIHPRERETRKQGLKLGSPVERLECGCSFSVVYFSRGTLPPKKR